MRAAAELEETRVASEPDAIPAPSADDDAPAAESSDVSPQAGEEREPGTDADDETDGDDGTDGDDDEDQADEDEGADYDEDEGEDEDSDEVDAEDEAGDDAPAADKPKRGRRLRRGGASKQPAGPPPAPTRRRRARRDPNAPIPVVRAQAKYVRCSARKARLVCDHIRGKSVEDARAILAVTPRAIARDWSKLLESAVANAEHNHELVGEDLYIKAIKADEGPTIKRFRPRAMGRASKIRKRTSHLTILLTPKE
jgi:ribosomal protein L22